MISRPVSARNIKNNDASVVEPIKISLHYRGRLPVFKGTWATHARCAWINRSSKTGNHCDHRVFNLRLPSTCENRLAGL
jgi:hypothetical protein